MLQFLKGKNQKKKKKKKEIIIIIIIYMNHKITKVKFINIIILFQKKKKKKKINSAQWGYQPGGWGEAPVDEFGQPLYGDVFGTEYTAVPEEVKINIYI